jgi:hypothetical protein
MGPDMTTPFIKLVCIVTCVLVRQLQVDFCIFCKTLLNNFFKKCCVYYFDGRIQHTDPMRYASWVGKDGYAHDTSKKRIYKFSSMR